MTTPPDLTPLPHLDPRHDGRHALPDEPLQRESMPYIVSLPEHGFAAAIYTWVNADSQAGSLFSIFGPAVGEDPVISHIDQVAVSPEQNFDNWSVGPVRIAHQLDLESASIHAECARGRMDLEFQASHRAYAYGSDPRGCPEFAATNRLEQSGYLRGQLEFDGKRYGIDTTGARDHSWGVRDWDYAQHWKWLHAQAGDVAVHFWQIQVEGREELRGYVNRDGLMVQITQLEVDFEVNPDCRQSRIRARILDAAGRSTEVSGEYFGHFEFAPSPTAVLVEGAMACEIDGRKGAGWTEFMWPSAYLSHLRARRRG